VLVMGMGHGWDVPLRYTFYGFMLFPAGLAVLTRRGGSMGLLDRIVIGAGFLSGLAILADLLTSDFHSPSYDSSFGPPYAAVAAIAAAGIGLLLWGRHAGRKDLWPEIALLTVALLTDLGLFYEARYGDSIWHYRGDIFEHLWFFLWSLWQWAAAAALAVRALAVDEDEAVEE
jgi:hypothetical protein